MSESEGNGGNVTIKLGPGYEAPWIVINEGSTDASIAWALKFAGLTDEDKEGKTPAEVFITAVAKIQLAYAGALLENGLGAKQETKSYGGGGARRNTGSRPNVPNAGAGAAKKDDSPPWADDDPKAGILAEIAAASTALELKAVYANNAKAFADEQKAGEDVLVTAFKARTAELTK